MTPLIEQYAKELEGMNAKDFTEAISELPLDTQLNLAISRTPIIVWAGQDMSSAKEYTQQVDYMVLAKILLEKHIA